MRTIGVVTVLSVVCETVVALLTAAVVVKVSVDRIVLTWPDTVV